MMMVLTSQVLLPLLPALAPPLDLGVVVRVGSTTLAVKVVDKHLKQSLKKFKKVVNHHLLVLLLRLDHLDLRVLLLQACSRSFPRRARLMRGAGRVAEA